MSFARAFRRLSALAGLAGIFGASLSGCGGGGGGGGGTGIIPGPGGTGAVDFTTRAACRANAAKGGKHWTILVYMNAANNLQTFSVENVAQMASVGSDSNVNIVVQWKQAGCGDCGTPTFTGTRRYLLKQHSAADISAINNFDTSVLDPDRLADPSTNNSSGTSDMGDWRTLQNFVQWGSTNYPADNLAVVIWDHGSGWQPTRAAKTGKIILLPKKKTRAVSQDDDTNNEIETEQLPQALASVVQPLDMLIIDCSLEQMVEVAYEVRKSARVMVGSEESPPGAGYPYDKWIADLKASGTNPCVVGKSIVDEFVANYPAEVDITQSMLDLSKLDNVASAVNTFGQSLINHSTDQNAAEIVNARNNAQFYAYPDNKDLFNYAELIRTTASSTDLQSAAVGVENAVLGTNGAVLYAKHGTFTQGGVNPQAGSNGLAIWIPDPGDYALYGAAYPSLAFAQATVWNSFIKSQRQ